MILNFNKKIYSGFQIKATCSIFPEDYGEWYSNEDIYILKYGKKWRRIFSEKNFNSEYYFSELGFKNRYWVHRPDKPVIKTKVTTEALMIRAADKIIRDNKINLRGIDLVISVTTTSNKYTSALSPSICKNLGIKATCLEIKAGCSSILSALAIGFQYLSLGLESVLIVCAETYSKCTSIDSNFLYAVGDGAGAIILERSNLQSRPIFSFLITDSDLSNSMVVKGILPPNIKDIENNKYFLEMSSDISHDLMKKWKEIPKTLYKNIQITPKDISCYVPHQVNKNMWEGGRKALNISKEKSIYTLPDYANCGSVTLLLALDYAIKSNLIQRGEKLFLSSVGGGVTYGGFLLDY